MAVLCLTQYFWFWISLDSGLEYPKLENIEMKYTMIISFDSKTNNLSLGCLWITQDILGISDSVQQYL